MMRKLIKLSMATLITAVACATAVVYAGDSNLALNNDIKSQITEKLVGQGYTVRKIKVEDGMYEAYAKKDGGKYEIYMSKDLEIVNIKED